MDEQGGWTGRSGSGGRGGAPDTGDPVYSVSDVTALVKELLESELAPFWVEGEISNFKHHSSGHMYFTLKDESSRLSCVMFRFANARLSFAPADGTKVVAWGKIKVYEPAGRYQLYVERMRPAGVGDLAAAFENLKRRLREEGLFEDRHKRPIPAFPRVVAVVTSPTGAAVRDVIRVIGRRFPATGVVVVPAPVQGAAAAPGLVGAIETLDEWGGADVAIVGRGGGSLEDLWAFNDEAVARAIFAARTPIVSAVGHEVDFTIADFVADVRAPTPSAAAEAVVPDRIELGRRVASLAGRAGSGVARSLDALRERVASLSAAYGFRLPRALVERFAERVDELATRLGLAERRRLESVRAGIDRVASELRLADPTRVMARGFAHVAVLPERAAVRSVADVSPGDAVRVTVADGAFDGRVESIHRKDGESR